MLKDYLVVAQEALSAQKEIYQVKQQRLELAQQEYQQLHAVWEHKLGSQVSCEYLPPPAPAPLHDGGKDCTQSCLARLSVLLKSASFLPSLLLVQTTILSEALLLLTCSDSYASFIPCLSFVCSHLRLSASLQTSSFKALQRLEDVGYREFFFNAESLKLGG